MIRNTPTSLHIQRLFTRYFFKLLEKDKAIRFTHITQTPKKKYEV